MLSTSLLSVPNLPLAGSELWCDEQIAVVVDGPEGAREVVVPGPLARIGSHPSSEIVLAAPGVAQRAVYLHATAEGIFSFNLDIEEATLEDHGRWLGQGDVIRVGPYQLSARRLSGPDAGSQNLPSLVAWGSATAPLPVMNVYCGNLLKDKRRFRARLNVLGRRPQCSLRLRGPRVSSFHCALYWDQRRLWCIDLFSSNVTQLNGVPINCAEMQLHDRLEVGEFGLVYERWSPRSMFPGWQPGMAGMQSPESAADAPAVGATSDSDLFDEGLRDVPFVKPLFDSAAAAEQQAIRELLAKDLSLLAQEREEFRQQRELETQQLAARIAQVEEESARLAGERAAFELARQEWLADRQTQAAELARRAAELAPLQIELSEVGAEPDDRRVCPKAAAVVETQNVNEPTALSLEPAMSPEATADTYSAPVIAGRSEWSPGRKTKAPVGDLTGFVTARILHIEDTKRRTALLAWSALGLAAATVSVLTFGLWNWWR